MLERKRTWKKVIVACAAVAVMMVGAASAYFTSTKSAENVWTVGNVSIELNEDAYNAASEAGKTSCIVPDQILDKDPKIVNDGNNDAYVFMEFSIPKKAVITANDDGTKSEEAVREMFTYTIDEDWYLVTDDKTDEDVNTYVYAYGSSNGCTSLEAGQTTSSVFKQGKIRFINVIEEQAPENLIIPVTAYAIQTADIGTEGNADPSEIWSVLSRQNG